MRHPNLLSAADTVLVVVDVQQKLMNVIHQRDRVIENTVKLIPSLSKRGTVIILSGHLNSEIEALAREAGAYAALEKSSKQHMGRVQIKHFVQRAGEVQRRNAILDEATGYLDRATDRLTQLGKVFEQGV